ncbi:MAG TPA: LysR family transcriptional regulator [Herbaspirillum sp.]
MDSGISLRHLRVFIAVAELGGATKAAESLYRAQSAVTRSIQELENSLGVQLFERKANGMLPTIFGQTLLFRAKRAAREFELARQEIAAGGSRKSGQLSGRFGSLEQLSASFSVLFNEHRLAAFLALSKLRHMPTVSVSLGITQPAVSASIGKLEASLGVMLFTRTPRGMFLTEAGELLLFRAKRALAELRNIKAEIAALSGTMEGRVTVGVLPLGQMHILPRAIAKVVVAHPQLKISTIEGNFDPLATQLRAGDIDFILGALRPLDDARDLIGEPLLSDKMALFVRGDHPLTRLPRITVADLLNAQWVLPSQGTNVRKLFDLSFTQMNVKPPAHVVETDSPAILRDLLLNSDMVTAVSLQWFYYERMAGELRVLDFDLQQTARMIGITQRQESYLLPGAAALIEAIRQVIAGLGPSNTYPHSYKR